MGFNEANIVGKVSVRRCMGRPAANKCKLGETSASGKGEAGNSSLPPDEMYIIKILTINDKKG